MTPQEQLAAHMRAMREGREPPAPLRARPSGATRAASGGWEWLIPELRRMGERVDRLAAAVRAGAAYIAIASVVGLSVVAVTLALVMK